MARHFCLGNDQVAGLGCHLVVCLKGPLQCKSKPAYGSRAVPAIDYQRSSGNLMETGAGLWAERRGLWGPLRAGCNLT